ncbi:MAG: hypothetical protein ACPGYV_00425 [Phycisphaeraceae bacterium]
MTGDVSGIFAGLCICCWVVPLIALGLPYVVFQSIRYGVQTRGVQPDGMYCAGCRFDVRGATGERCPECGEDLLSPASPRRPRGGILIDGLDPPMSAGVRVVLYLLVGAAPMVFGALIVGLMLPINYDRTLSVSLAPKSNEAIAAFGSTQLDFGIDAERSWLAPSEFDRLESWDVSWQTLDAFNKVDPPDQTAARQVWASVVEEWGIGDPSAVSSAVGDEYVAILLAACSFDRDAAKAQAYHFRMDWVVYSYPSYHPVYVVLAIAAVVGGLVLLVRWAMREAESNQRDFFAKVQRVNERYREMLSANDRPAPE